MTNHTLAEQLQQQAARLEREGTNLFRARAFRRAASVVAASPVSLADLYQRTGRAGLAELPGIGRSIAFSLEMLLTTGEFVTLRAADAHREPASRATSLPGVGKVLGYRLRTELGVATLEDLEEAQERLDDLLGARRSSTLRLALEQRRHQGTPKPASEPSVEDLLTLDREYRRKVEDHEGPHARHQPGEPAGWCPELRTTRDGWTYRVRFAFSALAHRLGMTRDWVVIDFEREGQTGQRTVVSERPDQGGVACDTRVVRGRERECRLRHLHLTSSSFGPEPAA